MFAVVSVAVDAIQAVNLCCDTMMSEIDNGKMQVLLKDVMLDSEGDGKGECVSPPSARRTAPYSGRS